MLVEARAEFITPQEAEDRLAICFSSTFGMAVKAMSGTAPGMVLDRFTGTVGPDISQHSLQVRAGLHIADTRFVGYLSHGCEPNCALDMERFELVALREIAANEVLTIDYAATEDVLHAQFACRCGAEGCRGWITGRNDPVNAAGEAYLTRRAAASPQA